MVRICVVVTGVAGAILVVFSGLLFLVWGLLFGGNVYGNCETVEYAEVPGTGSYCCRCVLVRAKWSETQSFWITPLGYPGCWTRDPLDKIRLYLVQHYPMNTNQSCYRRNGIVSYGDELVAESLFYGGIATGAAGAFLLLAALVTHLVCRRPSSSYQALVVNSQ